jgi:hypothetical protein
VAAGQRALAATVPGVIVAHSGPLSAEQQLWVVLFWAGRGALLAGLTAARLDGLRGFGEPGIHLLVPAARHLRNERTSLPVVVHPVTSAGCVGHPSSPAATTYPANPLVDRCGRLGQH